MATVKTWEEIIRSNYEDLMTKIDTENGLFGELQKAGVLNEIALRKIWESKDTTARVYKILENLQKNDFEFFKKFCGALENSGQEHIVKNHLSQVKEIVIDPRRRVCVEISKEISNCLVDNWNHLIANIDCSDEFLAELEKRETFTKIQLNKWRDMQPTERIEPILTILLKRGLMNHFNDFCESLYATKQQLIVAKYLTNQKEKDFRNNEKVPVPEQNGKENSEEVSTEPPKVNKDPLEEPWPVSSGEIIFKPCSQEFLASVEEKVRSKEAYEFDSKPRGRAIIISNEEFASLSKRHGAEKDETNLDFLFTGLQFETTIHTNLTAEQMMNVLEAESKEQRHGEYKMFILFLLSHGTSGKIYGVDGKPVSIEEIMILFDGNNCPLLINKPKLFFIQACQGDLKTEGVEADSASPQLGISSAVEEMLENLKKTDELEVKHLLPSLPDLCYQSDAIVVEPTHEKADMAITYATVNGHVAWRRTDTGSFFVSSIVDVFTKNAHKEDLVSMLTKVCDQVHDKKAEQDNKSYKQISETRQRLRKKVYILPAGNDQQP